MYNIKKLMYNKDEILYPIFLKCCLYATDKFWSSIFEDLSHGITPYGTYISKNYFCCSYKNKEFSYYIDETKNAKDVYNEIYNILSKKLNILSINEKMNVNCDFEDFQNNIKNSKDSWTSIRKKISKDLIIEKYVVRMKNEYNLSYKQCRYLLKLIHLGIVLKTINNKDIIYEDGEITKIVGIEIEDNKIILDKELFRELETNNEVITNENYMKDNWEKYIKELYKMKN